MKLLSDLSLMKIHRPYIGKKLKKFFQFFIDTAAKKRERGFNCCSTLYFFADKTYESCHTRYIFCIN